MDNSINPTTGTAIPGTQAAADAASNAANAKNASKPLVSNASNTPQNNANALAFLLLLFKSFASEDVKNEEEIIKDFEEAFEGDLGLFSGIIANIGDGESPVLRALSNERVSNVVREKFNIENPLEFATSARDIFQDHKGDAWEGFLDHLMKREGYRNTVYLDSLGKPTVGVGHLVRPEDNLRVGDRISDARVMEFMKKDASSAYEAAIKQAQELGIEDKNVVIGLASVNYQLGLGWRNKFPSTWEAMKNGDFEAAISKVEGSKWNKQTPVRVDDFQNTLARAAAIRDGKVEVLALNDTGGTQVVASLTAQHASTMAQGGVAQTTPPASATEAFTLTQSTGGVDQVAAANAPAKNDTVYEIPALIARTPAIGANV